MTLNQTSGIEVLELGSHEELFALLEKEPRTKGIYGPILTDFADSKDFAVNLTERFKNNETDLETISKGFAQALKTLVKKNPNTDKYNGIRVRFIPAHEETNRAAILGLFHPERYNVAKAAKEAELANQA